jgi:hypothetical protein
MSSTSTAARPLADPTKGMGLYEHDRSETDEQR